MAQGEFTKQEAKRTQEAVEELYDAIPKSRRLNYLGHLNDIFLFVGAAAKVAPEAPNEDKNEQ